MLEETWAGWRDGKWGEVGLLDDVVLLGMPSGLPNKAGLLVIMTYW